MLYSSGTTGRPKGVKHPLEMQPLGTLAPLALGIMAMYQANENSVYLSPAPLYHAAPLGFTMTFLRLRRHRHRDGALRRGGGPGLDREAPRHPQPVGADDVRAHAEAPRGGARPPRRLEPHPCDPRRGAVPHPGEGADDRVVGAGHPRVLRRHRGQRLLQDRQPRVARAQGERRQAPERRRPHPRRGDRGRAAPGEIGGVYFESNAKYEYHKAPEKTAEAKSKQGYTTLGDVGYVDEDGWLYLTDRKAFMIISGGVNIYPQETENCLITHPKVTDVAVIGVPNEDFGEEVKAVVQPADMAEAGPELAQELIDWCKERISHVKCPRSVDFMEELPRHPTGKLYKRLLKDRYWGKADSTIV